MSALVGDEEDEWRGHPASVSPEMHEYAAMGGRDSMSDEGPVFTPASSLQRILTYTADRFQPGSIKGSVFTLIAAVVGAGTLSLPFALSQAGLLLGVFFLLAFAASAVFSIHMLIVARDESGVTTYRGLAEAAGGRRFGAFSQVLLLLYTFGTTTGYIIAAGNLVKLCLQAVGAHLAAVLADAHFYMVTLALAVAYPLSLARSMSALRFTSVLGTACVVYLTLALTGYYLAECHSQPHGCVWNRLPAAALWPKHVGDVFRAVPLSLFAYTCHCHVLPIFVDLQRPSPRRMYKILRRSIATAATVYVLAAVSGYLLFLEDTKGNILLNDFHHSPPIVAAGIGMAVTVMLAAPLIAHGFKGEVELLLFDGKQPSYLRHVLTISLLFAVATGVAVSVGNLATVLSFLGATVNPIMCFVIPTYVFCALVPNTPLYKAQKIIAVAICVAIVGACVASLVALFDPYF